MPCPACQIHSFEPFGVVRNAALYYTAPAKSPDFRDSENQVADFKLHLNLAKGAPWIWIIDCGTMSAKHSASFQFTRGVSQILINEHEDMLKEIWILRPNTWSGAILKGLKMVFRSKLFTKVRIVEGNPLRLYEFFKDEGLSLQSRKWLASYIPVESYS